MTTDATTQQETFTPVITPFRRRIVLFGAMVANFMTAVESTIVSTALPSIVADLGGFHLFSWVFAVYLLGQAATIPIYGRLADLYGRKPIFAIGAILFLVSSLLCGFASSMPWLIAFRAAQGLGAGCIATLSATIVGDVYPGSERGKAQSYLGIIWGVAAVIGPLLGAFLIQHFSWALVFWVNLPVGVVALVLFELALIETPSRRHSVDYLGSVLLMIGIGALMLTLIQWSQLSGEMIAGLLVVGVVTLVALYFRERSGPEPMLSFDLWKIPIFAAAVCAIFAVGGVMMGVSAFLPTFVQGVLGRDAILAGFALTSMCVGWTTANFIQVPLMRRYPYRVTALLGAICILCGSAQLVLLTPTSHVLQAVAGALTIGLGMGFSTTTYIVVAQNSVDPRFTGRATSMIFFTRMLGQSIAAAIFGGILNIVVGSHIGANANAVDALMAPETRAALDPATMTQLTDALASALHGVYIAQCVFALMAFVLALRMPKGLGVSTER